MMGVMEVANSSKPIAATGIRGLAVIASTEVSLIHCWREADSNLRFLTG
jgi:hypothetical protein